jgi:hypothetical protein
MRATSGAAFCRASTRPSAVSSRAHRAPTAPRTPPAAPGRHHVADGDVTAGQAQLARVHPVRAHGDEGLRDEALLLAERLQRGLLAGGVAVEGEHDLAAHLVLVHQQAAEQPDVVGAEGRAAGGHGRGDAREVARHDVGVALDDDGLRRRAISFLATSSP